jgi:Uncharacterised nucleotidyltransferase
MIELFGNEERFWPSEEQTLLLKACLLEDEKAFVAWEDWYARADTDHLDQGSFRLIPLLYKRLRKMGVRKKIMNLFAGIYRMAWYKNRRLLYSASQLIKILGDRGISSLLLKGGAHSMLYYKDFGVRPVWDIDLMVKTDQVIEAHEVLEKAGWHSVDRSIRHHLPFWHASSYRNAEGMELDLHWYLLPESRDREADADFWVRAKPAELHGAFFYVLSATDQLFHVCIHGSVWNPVPTFRWIPDAMAIINHDEFAVSWHRLIEQARKRHLLLRLRESLVYLKDNFEADIPDAVLTKLHGTTPTRFERIDYRYSRRNNTRSVFGSITRLLLKYHRITNDLNWTKRIEAFPSFVTYKYNLNQKRQIPRYVMREIINVLKQ